MIRRASSPRPRLERPAGVFLDSRSMPITALALIFGRARRRPSADRTTWAGRPTVTSPRVSESIATVLEPAGLEKAKGLITGAYNEDVTDARWKRGAAERQQRSFVIILMPRQLSCPFALLTV